MLPLCLSFIFCTTAGMSEPPFDPHGLLLFDFESPKDLTKWQVRDLTDLELTTRWCSHGRSAAAITYHAWEQTKEEWPAIIATHTSGALLTADFTPYDVLTWEVHNPSNQPASFNLHLRDAQQKRFSRSFTIQPKTTHTFEVRVADIGQAINTSQITELHFYITRPTTTYSYYLDNVRLAINLRPALDDLAKRVKSLIHQVQDIRPQAERMGAQPIVERLHRLDSLYAQLRQLRVRIDQDELQDRNDVEKARERIARLEEDYIDAKVICPAMDAVRFLSQSGGGQFALATETSMRKVFLEAGRFASQFNRTYRLYTARNEYESFQTIIFPVTGDIRNVRWSLKPPTNTQGAQIPTTVRVVGYVDCKAPSYDVPHGGWWPDPLLDYAYSIDRVPFGEVLPLWITVEVPSNAEPGMYRGQLTVSADGCKDQSVSIRLMVWNFVLPEHTHLRTALSFRGGLENLYPNKPTAEMTKRYEDWMLGEYYLNPGSIYSGPPKWNADRLRELLALGMNGLNLAYFNAPRGPDFNAEDYWRKFDELVAKIEAYLPTVEAAGARDLCYIYCFDERPPAQLDVVFETARRLKQKWPDIEVMTTASDATFGLERAEGAAVDIWVPLTPKFDTLADRIAEARTKGRDIWWYICIGPQHPYANWFVEYPAIEARLLMGAMTAKYRPGGFLYYAVNRWPENKKVCEGAPRTDWNPASYKNNNGDGSVMVAGPNGPLATIRLENIRDGIEDYEYYLLLREFADDDSKLAQVPEAVVVDLTHFTHDPEVLYRERERLAGHLVTAQRQHN
ncbi:MAG: glycoside hydrolase domain-containing protein [Candidatus Zipacnadales bacterium]